MEALKRYPKHKRHAVAKEWARRSHIAQQKLRDECGPDADTMRKRSLDDARGLVVREGCTYTATGETNWQIRRSIAGRVDQFDLVANGSVLRTSGPRKLPARFRP